MSMEGLQIAYYGDDFTGSTDVMEVLATNGLETVLFLATPALDRLAQFPHCHAVGLAGISRSQTPEWMDRELPRVFEWLKGLGARLTHYKVCSTFDSAPHTGSIGRAIDLAQRTFASPHVPVVAGMPSLKRYLLFGNLFATVGAETFRIDRHPVMSRHPVTPMDEGDLRLHLSRQTEKRIGLIDILALHNGTAEARRQSLVDSGCEVILYDTLDAATARETGRLLWDGTASFTAGSSGVEYALIEYWRSTGALDVELTVGDAGETDRIAVLSGSCSPVTEAQIGWAQRNGFAMVPLDTAALAGGPDRGAAFTRAVQAATGALAEGRSAVLYSAFGSESRLPLDNRGRETLARHSGEIFRAVLDRAGVRRAVVAGGDTSSHAGQLLGVYALTFRAAIAPGAPLCRAWSSDAARDGMDIVFKGGQCGREDFFEQVRKGKQQ